MLLSQCGLVRDGDRSDRRVNNRFLHEVLQPFEFSLAQGV
jgi:hypothetical protein